ncbi:hypothetical protein MTO96_020557 [Rhipicephalus appendiculatus]
MDVGEGTTLREEGYGAADWTTIIGTYEGKSKASLKNLREASENSGAFRRATGGTHRNALAWRPTCIAASDVQKSANGSTAATCRTYRRSSYSAAFAQQR